MKQQPPQSIVAQQRNENENFLIKLTFPKYIKLTKREKNRSNKTPVDRKREI